MLIEQRVQRHFNADAPRFDAIYRARKGIVARFVDDFWRGVVRKRLELNLQYLDPLTGKTVLDVGCGSGRFCVAYAARGATRVVGVDLAAAMIELAVKAAHEAKVSDRCEFRRGAFPEAVSEQVFDASTANGVFDYVADPVPVIKSMRKLTRETMILSFPKAFEWRVPVRWIRFRLNGCPLYLYTKSRVREILDQGGITNYEWIELDRDYLVVVKV